MLPLEMATPSSLPSLIGYLENPVTGRLLPPNKRLIEYVADQRAQRQEGKTHPNTRVLIALVAQWEADGNKKKEVWDLSPIKLSAASKFPPTSD